MLLLISHWPNLVTACSQERSWTMWSLLEEALCPSHTELQLPWMKRTIDGEEVQPVVSAILFSEP